VALGADERSGLVTGNGVDEVHAKEAVHLQDVLQAVSFLIFHIKIA
jgi:hypothetical protein